MKSIPTRQELRQLLAHTGVMLPESKLIWTENAAVWTTLALIHFALVLGIGGMLIWLWPFIH